MATRGYGATLWTPDPKTVQNARITHYQDWLKRTLGATFTGYDDLWAWSVANPGAFWDSVWEYFGVLGDRGTARR